MKENITEDTIKVEREDLIRNRNENEKFCADTINTII